MRKRLIALTAFALLAAQPAQASANSVKPVELLTRSLSAYYVTLVQCKEISDRPETLQNKIDQIRSYVGGLYPAGIPYWALPSNIGKLEDEATCAYLLNERRTSYLKARQLYVRNYPKDDRPPSLLGDQIDDAAILRGYEKKRLRDADDRERTIRFEW